MRVKFLVHQKVIFHFSSHPLNSLNRKFRGGKKSLPTRADEIGGKLDIFGFLLLLPKMEVGVLRKCHLSREWSQDDADQLAIFKVFISHEFSLRISRTLCISYLGRVWRRSRERALSQLWICLWLASIRTSNDAVNFGCNSLVYFWIPRSLLELRLWCLSVLLRFWLFWPPTFSESTLWLFSVIDSNAKRQSRREIDISSSAGFRLEAGLGNCATCFE